MNTWTYLSKIIIINQNESVDEFDKLGNDGWELVSVNVLSKKYSDMQNNSYKIIYHCIFKQKIEVGW